MQTSKQDFNITNREEIEEVAHSAFPLLEAAESGNADAQNELGYCYQNGLGVEQSDKQAAYWYQKAAEQEHVDAQNALGFCYQKGLGVDQSDKQAVFWYQKAAKLENTDAQFNLGVYCQQGGVGVDVNIRKLFMVSKSSSARTR